MPDERLVGDVAGAAEYLRALPGRNGKVGVIGYCSGGRQSFLAACSLAARRGRGLLRRVRGQPAARGHAAQGAAGCGTGRKTCPARCSGCSEPRTSFPGPAETAELSKVLDDLGKRHEFHTYESAGHAFFAVNRPAYRVEAANDGWQRIWDFYGRYLAS